MRPTIISASISRVASRGHHRADHLAGAHDTDAIRHGEDLAQLVGDEDDALALRGERFMTEQLVRFLGVRTAVGSSRIRISAFR